MGCLKQADHAVECLIVRLRHCGQIRRADTPVCRGATHCRWGANLGVCGNAVDLARTLPHGPIHHGVTKDHAIRHYMQDRGDADHGVPFGGERVFSARFVITL